MSGRNYAVGERFTEAELREIGQRAKEYSRSLGPSPEPMRRAPRATCRRYGHPLVIQGGRPQCAECHRLSQRRRRAEGAS